MDRSFTVDYDSLPELLKLTNRLHSRIGDLQAATGLSRRARHRQMLNACQIIWEADIDFLYKGRGLCDERKFYVYAHLDATRQIALERHAVTSFAATLGMTHFPFYVGKGTGNRSQELDRSETHRKVCQKMRLMGLEPKVVHLKELLTEAEALAYESKLIDIFGLIPHKGMLCNLDEGLEAAKRRMVYKESYLKLRVINKQLVA